MTRAYIGIGSNLGDREGTLARAVAALGALAGTEVVGISTLRETEPVGIVDQPLFLNGAVALETGLSPRELLEALLTIERDLGRVREGVPKGGPRAVDLDLLLYGDEEIDEPDLRIPHPRMAERAFVLEPLADLDDALEVPGKGPIQTLLARLHSSA